MMKNKCTNRINNNNCNTIQQLADEHLSHFTLHPHRRKIKMIFMYLFKNNNKS